MLREDEEFFPGLSDGGIRVSYGKQNLQELLKSLIILEAESDTLEKGKHPNEGNGRDLPYGPNS